MHWSRSLFVFPLLLLLVMSCNPKKEKEDKSPLKLKARPPKKVHFFLETSASMGGYLKGKTEFKDVVSNLITVLGTDSIWTISESAKSYSGTRSDFIGDLAKTPLASGRSSQLHLIIDKVAKKAGSNDVSILVSDCILSFPDSAIKANPQINRDNASSTLKSYVQEVFMGLREKKTGTTLYAFQSAFNGTYYDYQNHKQILSAEQRPFYVWVIGSYEVLEHINHTLQERGFQSEKMMDFGKENVEENAFALLKAYKKAGKWNPSNNKLIEIKLKKEEPVEFSIGVNLAHVPKYVLDSLTRQQFTVNSENAKVELLEIRLKESVLNEQDSKEKPILKNPKDKAAVNESTHILKFRLNDLYKSNATMTIILPYRADSWYKDWSTDDDLTADKRSKKTFAFQHLVEGVKGAYGIGNKNYLNIQLSFSK